MLLNPSYYFLKGHTDTARIPFAMCDSKSKTRPRRNRASSELLVSGACSAGMLSSSIDTTSRCLSSITFKRLCHGGDVLLGGLYWIKEDGVCERATLFIFFMVFFFCLSLGRGGVYWFWPRWYVMTCTCIREPQAGRHVQTPPVGQPTVTQTRPSRLCTFGVSWPGVDWPVGCQTDKCTHLGSNEIWCNDRRQPIHHHPAVRVH